MRGIVFENYKQFPVLKDDLKKPKPGPGEVLLKVAGAGACHSDVAIFQNFSEGDPGAQKPPFILGHESSGWVEEVGPGVNGFTKGDAYLIYGPIGCQHCKACSRGQDTYCENAGDLPYAGIGLGRDGGMAEYVSVPARNLVALGDADPIAAAPLADAGLTPYHAVKLAVPKLAGGGKYALVIGLGGLGLLGVQMITALTGATVIATDTKPSAMTEAQKLGAITVPSGKNQVAKIREITDGRGVDAAFDFVGISDTIKTAMACMAVQGRCSIAGIAGHPYEWSFYTSPYEVDLTSTYWGTIEDLHEVVALFKLGKIKSQYTPYNMDQAIDAYTALVNGELSGRAVVVPHA